MSRMKYFLNKCALKVLVKSTHDIGCTVPNNESPSRVEMWVSKAEILMKK